jgi:Capsule assembly protein Wzi
MPKWKFHVARLERVPIERKAFRVIIVAVTMAFGSWGPHNNELIAAPVSGQGHAGQAHNPADMGSPYVPLDSWIYPAFARLAAMGYVRTAMLGMKPWTRLECARLVEEAEDRLDNPDANPPEAAVQTFKALREKFRADIKLLDGESNKSTEIESVYTRVTGINGKPLTDAFDFGQTIYNDFGRPYEEGTNAVSGFTSWAAFGPLVGYVRAEYQHAPSAPPLPQAARSFISANLGLPPMPALSTPEVDRMDMLEGYVGFTFHSWEISAGKQSVWWGPDAGSSLIYSDNAEPLDMVRINRVMPFKLPSILGLMGPIRVEFWMGQQHGAQFIYNPSGLVGQWGQDLSPQPIIHGQGVSFKPTPDLEFGFNRTTIYGGPGYPLTLHTFLRSLFSTANTVAGVPNKPGDRQSGFDMTYRLPFVRDWATFYVQSFNDDEVSPIAYFDKSINSAGLYFNRLPRLPKFDLRLEGLYSNLPIGGNEYQHGYFYTDGTWRYGQRNAGNLFTSWIGREGQGEQAWLTYWRTPQRYIQLQYRHQTVGADFVPHGGTINDGGVKFAWWFQHDLEVSALLQYERWDFPILAQGQQADFTTSVEMTYWPRWKIR